MRVSDPLEPLLNLVFQIYISAHVLLILPVSQLPLILVLVHGFILVLAAAERRQRLILLLMLRWLMIYHYERWYHHNEVVVV